MSDRLTSHQEITGITFEERYSRSLNTYAVKFKYVYTYPNYGVIKSDPNDFEYTSYVNAVDELDAMVQFNKRRVTNLEN